VAVDQPTHFDYIGTAITEGKVISAPSSTVPGFLGVGCIQKESIVVFVPATSANFSEIFLGCDSYYLGELFQVQVNAHNVTQ
jgi:hypothetical protein